MAKKKRRVIPLWFRFWEPRGKARRAGRGGRGATGTIARATGGRFGGCGDCGSCLCGLILLIIIFGAFFGGGFGFADDGGGGATAPDEPENKYYQLIVNIVEGDGELAADMNRDNIISFGPNPGNFTVDIHTPLVFVESFNMMDNEEGKSTYDYITAFPLYIEIYNETFDFYGDEYIFSNTISTVYIIHLGSTVFTATLTWRLNGAGIRY